MTFEEIRSLQNELAMSKEIIKNQKKQISKGRKIVAMLFWEYKQSKNYTSKTVTSILKCEFERAYKIFRETK